MDMSDEQDAKQISSFIRIFSNYLNTIEKKMSNEQLTFNEIKVMLELYEADNLTARDIEERLDLDKSYMSRILKNLADLEFIEKEQSFEDKRLFYLSLTKKGKEAAKQLYYQYLDVLEEDLEILSSPYKGKLIDAMKMIESHYQKEENK
ncbi:MarR family transcriptional regulator [Vagococcus zengguangii]|nr:MarR family transcriptional regulator [Vagococcus zengguangii]